MIEAMKLALEALETTQTLMRLSDPQYVREYNAITSLRQAIAEAEKQEPVATVHASWNDDEGFMLVKRTGERLNMGDSLYTHPQPKREPLTDEQIAEFFGVKAVDESFVDFVRAIEAAHGIKE